ncbi:sialate O-acetylesterase [Mangrovibacterium sp.]|uniref:sialate O-acetylesterase n=1 Tax=Mangrovibacterium sp. TaxID=1961364 RepID=UPI003569D72D
MRYVILFILSSILYTAFGQVGTSAAPHYDKAVEKDSEFASPKSNNLDIYLLIGQSNMAGRADIEPQDLDSLEGVFLFTGIEGNEWEKAANPLNKYSTVRKAISMQKMGPGYTFAREMAKANSGKPIGLVVNAKGGTSIAEWAPGDTLYTEAVKRVKMAMQFGTLKGIVWHQGEANVSKSDAYPEKITELIQSLRTDLGIPDLPFVAGQLSEDKTARHAFNEMILTLPALIPNTGVATSEGTSTIDNTHFNAASQRLLGERYAAEMLKLFKNQTSG